MVPLLFIRSWCVLGLLILCVCSESNSSQEVVVKDGSTIQRFLNAAEVEGIINQTQLSQLQELAVRLRVGVVQSDQDNETLDDGLKQESVFFKIYNQFTLLNVLYVSGALLIMGAFTLFMTIAYEKFNHLGLGAVMLVPTVLFGSTGVLFWQNDQSQFVGGLLCTISTSMVPFTVYNFQRALGLWPENEDPGIFQGFRMWIRPGWVVMEIATIVIGFTFLTIVRFPFLLFPVSFCLWFLSMDLAPLYPGFTGLESEQGIEIRRRVSLGFGIGMMVTGFVFEKTLGSHPDMGFWLYMFGIFIFWCTLNFSFPRSDLIGSLFLLLNIGLVLVGSHLDRTTFHVFGTLGVIEYTIGVCYSHIKTTNSVILWSLKAMAAAALFSQAIRRDGNLEIVGALVCMLAFNFNYINFISSGELYSLLLLVTNLGFLSVSAAFTRPLSLWLFTIPDCGLIVSLVCSLLVATYHLQLLVKYIPSPPNTLAAYFYTGYRLVASVAISFVFVFLRHPHFAWVGGLGIPLVAVCFSPVLREFVKRGHTSSSVDVNRGVKGVVFNLVTFALLLFGVTFATYLQSNLLHLICCVFMFVFVLCHLDKHRVLGCVLALLLVVYSVSLQSSFLITIGAVYIFGYLSYLAYDAFRNSLLFPLILVTLGLLMIFCGLQYQKYESVFHETFYSLLPGPIRVLFTQTISIDWQEGGRYDWFRLVQQRTFSLNSFVECPLCWVLWPGTMTFALIDSPAPYVSIVCSIAITLVSLFAVLLSYRQSLVKDLDEFVTVSSIKFALSRDPAHESHGIVISVKGTKAKHVNKPVHLALSIEGNSFWNAANQIFGEFAVNLGRSMILPYKLTPHLITLTGFKKGETQFTSEILLGTGHRGSQRMKHTTATSAVQRLLSSNDRVAMECVILYYNGWYKPWSKLCRKKIKLSDVKEQLV